MYTGGIPEKEIDWQVPSKKPASTASQGRTGVIVLKEGLPLRPPDLELEGGRKEWRTGHQPVFLPRGEKVRLPFEILG